MELTNLQTQEVLKGFLEQENGLNTVLQMILNSMMLSERDVFLDSSINNKGNGYRNGSVFGHGHQIELRIPRDRQSEFTPTILALFREQESYLKEVSFNLYSKGLTTRDISEVMEIIYGKHYSKSTISNISQSFYQQMEQWRNRELSSHYLAFYIDGLWVKLKRDKKYKNECFYIILGLREDYTREIIAIVNFPAESATAWELIFEELKTRGVTSVGLIISDGIKGMEQAIYKVFENTPHQKCVVHLARNLSAYVRSVDKQELAEDIKKLLSPDLVDYNLEQVGENIRELAEKWRGKYKNLSNYLMTFDYHNYFTYLNYSIHVRRMIYTTNWIERFNRSARRTLKIRGAFPNQESVLALITSTAMEKTTKQYAYPIYNFKFEDSLNKKNKPAH